jgi:beta-glucosidase
LGLFENPGRCDIAGQSRIACAEHQAVNLRAARESLVLLRNEPLAGRPLLPLDTTKYRTIALLGPNADNPLAQLGDWSLGSGQMTGASGPAHPRASITTVQDGLKTLLPDSCRLVTESQIAEADLVILVLGDNIPWIGETKSTATLELTADQIALSEQVMALGKPVAVVLVNSKPLVLPACLGQAAAIIEAFNPGMQGGTAIAEALLGLINPSGKLTISFPVHVGQQPVWYNQVRGQHGTQYADLTQDPAFSFGFGLSYTSFHFDTPILANNRLGMADTLKISLKVTNTGPRDGVEVVQLYIEDLVSSATWAVRELKAYQRVAISAGTSAMVDLSVSVSDLSIVDSAGVRVVEPGRFRALVGSSSRLSDLQAVEFELA